MAGAVIIRGWGIFFLNCDTWTTLARSACAFNIADTTAKKIQVNGFITGFGECGISNNLSGTSRPPVQRRRHPNYLSQSMIMGDDDKNVIILLWDPFDMFATSYPTWNHKMCKIACWSWESGFTLNTKFSNFGWTRLSVSMMVADEPNQRH